MGTAGRKRSLSIRRRRKEGEDKGQVGEETNSYLESRL